MKKLILILLALTGSASAEPWNGGKPTIPFTVTSTIKDGVAEGGDVKVPLLITPQRDCTQLAITVRTVDNIAAKPVHRTVATCKHGVAIAQPFVVSVPARGAGYVAVDISAQVGKRTMHGTYAIAVRGATGAFPHKTIGTVANGVESMTATER